MNCLDMEIVPKSDLSKMHRVDVSVPVVGIGMSPYVKYSVWCIDHVSVGQWCRKNSSYYFTNKEDAVLFALSV